MAQLSVVTGGGGFVGRHLVNALLERGDEVRVLDVVEPVGLGGEFRKTDITDPAAVRAAIEGADVVFHNASLVHTKQNKADFVWKVNYDGTRHVLEACQDLGVGKLVYVSSGSVVYDGDDVVAGGWIDRTRSPEVAAEASIEFLRIVPHDSEPGSPRPRNASVDSAMIALPTMSVVFASTSGMTAGSRCLTRMCRCPAPRMRARSM